MPWPGRKGNSENCSHFAVFPPSAMPLLIGSVFYQIYLKPCYLQLPCPYSLKRLFFVLLPYNFLLSPTFLPCVSSRSQSFFIMQIPSIKSAISSFDTKISKSTFGRVFRLDGSGHVSCASNSLMLALTLRSRKSSEAQSSSLKYALA